jgi:hypothetical protein
VLCLQQQQQQEKEDETENEEEEEEEACKRIWTCGWRAVAVGRLAKCLFGGRLLMCRCAA